MRRVRVTQAADYDLVGEVIEDDDAARSSSVSANASTKKKRVSLKVLGSTPPRAHQ
jgi:hypothetical protein